MTGLKRVVLVLGAGATIVVGLWLWRADDAGRDEPAILGPELSLEPGTPPPARLRPGPWTADVSGLLAAGRTGDREAWRVLRDNAERLGPTEREQVRRAMRTQLGYAVHPTADYRGGAEAIELASAVADAPLVERMLSLLDDWSTVVLKLPLTERRDDLAALASIRQSVARVGAAGHDEKLEEKLRRLDDLGLLEESEAASAAPREGS